MPKRLIIIPFNLPWNWSTDYTNQTAFELAKNGNVVCCYLWSDAVYIKDTVLKGKFPRIIYKYNKNVYLITPWYFIPFIRFKFVMKLNSLINIYLLKVLVKVLKIVKVCKEEIFWIFDPNTIDIYKHFNNNSTLIYDCVDYFPGAVTPDLKEITIRNEKILLKKADLVVANSVVLQKYLSNYHSNVKLVPQGFRLDTFKHTKTKKSVIKRGSRLLIGFVGAVNHRLDYKMLYDLAYNNPNWDFAIWGKLLELDHFTVAKRNLYKKLTYLPNIITGQSEKKDVPSIVNQFDICMIPYDMTLDFNKYCYPMKIFEYFYLGKPIVSSDVVELRRFPDTIKIGKNSTEWKKIIEKLLSTSWPQNLKKLEKKLAIENSWEEKIRRILEFVG